MYRNKKDVDKHVQKLTSKLPLKEFQTRAYSIARLYFDVGDYASCKKYVEQYLTQKDNNAAAHKLLGLALQKMGQMENALEHYKISFDLDPTQTSTILDICELLADDEMEVVPGRFKYWCEKAEATFPRHPITFKLRERLLSINNPDTEDLCKFLKAEIVVRPKDVTLHTRLIKHYLQSNQIKEAFDHSCNIEFDNQSFLNNYLWYESVSEILYHNSLDTHDWLYQLLLLTVRERICVLSLTEVPNGSSKSLVESSELLSAYDQALECVSKAGAPPGFGDFHACLVRHHYGQLAFHTATYLLKKAKKNQLKWRDSMKLAGPLMLISWQIIPSNPQVKWLMHAPQKQQNAVHRFYLEGSYRCSQSGHYILSNIQENSQVFLDHISQFCAGAQWRMAIYEAVFSGSYQLQNNASYLMSNSFNPPALRLPRKQEVESYDDDAQRQYPNSLHHFVWILLNYKNFAKFKCSLFDMLTQSTGSYGAESLNKLDVLAFLYSATLTTQNKEQAQNKNVIHNPGKPNVLPANITDLLCTLAQMKWWDCAYKYSQKELGTDLTGIHATLSSGIEVVRCIDNHGLDPKLLYILGDIFSELAKNCAVAEEKNWLETRARLYYTSAINPLERLKSKVILKMPDKRLFDYTHKDFDTKELNAAIEECKMYIATSNINDGEYEKAIELLSSLKSPKSCYYLGVTYKKLAFEEKKNFEDINSEMKYATLLNKAKHFAYKALEKMKETNMSYKDSPLYMDTQELIEDIECCLNKLDPDISNSAINDFSSDENESLGGKEYISLRSNSNAYHKKNISSTPKPLKKQTSTANMTNYRTAVESQILETNVMDQQLIDSIEKQIKILQKRDTSINDFMEQTKEWFDENRKMSKQIINTINSNNQNTTEQFKLLKISVDQVKDQIEECKNECKDVGELKKQIAELKKEVNKLKKTSSEQTIDESDLYNLDDEYRANDNIAGFGTQLPFGPAPVLPQFAQRLVPPFTVPTNPYQLYGQNILNLYNQYSQFPQVSTVPGVHQIFDPTRSQANYPGAYATPDQMYLDVSHLVAPSIPTVSTVPTGPVVPTAPVSTVPTGPVPTVTSKSTIPVVTSTKISTPASKIAQISEVKDASKLPVNVVITSSDPLPVCTSAPTPILSVTIPQKHIKGSPHNYQIPLPSTNESKGLTSSPVFSFSSAGAKGVATTTTTTAVASFPSWNHSSIFATNQNDSSTSPFNLIAQKQNNSSKSVVDGVLGGASPNNSLNKSRTLSEKSNTSIENYDPCPDFKPIIPLPAEVKVTTGEEEETVIFSSRAKLFRFIDKQWKERGLGEMKLLKHKITGKVRVLMRREQIHKVCANHIISAEMEITPMKNETKAYFWVANDFAEETVILEKFCIRFKTEDIAKNFYEVFEKARQEASVNNKSDKNIKSSEETSVIKSTTTAISSMANKNITGDIGKTVIGGFTFSATPSFKPLSDSNNTAQKNADSSTTKTNIFSGLTFKTSTSSPFANILNTSSNEDPNSKPKENNSPSKLNTSDVIEEFEPNVEFKPVIPLPALIDQKTGEEDEIVLFEHRAKLLRFVASSKEWKERGLGNIKLLVHKDNVQKLRLLMRREQIMKVCCNHTVTKDMVFKKMPNMDKAVTWCAKDFSDGELVAETFCLRFKTVQTCDNFVSAIATAQSKIKDESKAIKEEQNASKQNSQCGFGDKFKPKPGSWHCETCYTNNLENFEQCACCEQPKPKGNNATTKSIIPASYSFGFGDKFKPKPGTWECKSCMVRNEADKELCSACNTPKNASSETSESTVKELKNPSMIFGIPGQTQSTLAFAKSTTAPVASGWGDRFKPKEGSWECNQCLVRNNENVDNCSACNNPRDPEATKTFKYNFGSVTADLKNKNQVTNLFETPSTQKFNFGIPANQTAIVVSFGEQKATTSVFAITKQPTATDGPINFCLKKTDESKSTKPALLPTPQLNWTEIKNFDFMGSKPKDQFNSCKITEISSNQSKNNEISQDDQKQGPQDKKQPEIKQDNESDDIIFVKEVQATPDQKEKAKELMLPENFFTYVGKDPCPGCRGCEDDTQDKKVESVKPPKVQQDISKPIKPALLNTSSVYGTPDNFEKTLDGSVFRTPYREAASVTSSSASSTDSDEGSVTCKEKTITETPKSNFKPTMSIKSSILMPSKLGSQDITKSDNHIAFPNLDAETSEIKSIFGNTAPGVSMNKTIFSMDQNVTASSAEPEVKSIFGTDDQAVNLFSSSSQGSIFGPAALKSFGSSSGRSTVFGNALNNTSTNIFNIKAPESQPAPNTNMQETTAQDNGSTVDNNSADTIPLNIDGKLTFAALSRTGPGFNEKKADFQWEGAGQQLFGTKSQGAGDNSVNASGKNTNATNKTSTADGEEEYDPHYEPIVPLPDEVVVTTGEEDEVKLFGERCKLYRYDEKTREWKERGVGEMKLLYHPGRSTYRLLLRREQVHKAVLNMLLFKNLALLPMKNTDRAWTWAGQNFAEGTPGQETLAVRFKSAELAKQFHDKVVECVVKLQASPPEEAKKEEEKAFPEVTPLRLPKHLETSARADEDMVAKVAQHTQATTVTEQAQQPQTSKPIFDTGSDQNGHINKQDSKDKQEQKKQEEEEEEEDEDEDEDYDHDYDNSEGYYNEEDEESVLYYACDCEAVIHQGESRATCEQAHVQVSFDQDLYSPKILVTDSNTGEILADMLIQPDTVFQMEGDSCTWSGLDFTQNDAVEKTVTLNFADNDTTMQFYDSCESGKGATYSTEPEQG